MKTINADQIPQIKLANGDFIPAIGMGTFGNDKYTPEEVSTAVYNAIKTGYRFFDGAAAYGNEQDIGNVYSRVINEGIVKRKDLYILSKVWNDMHGKGDVLVAVSKTLKDLQLDYLDAYLVHWPFPNDHAPGAGVNDWNPNARPFFIEEFMETWKQMERLADMGLVRHIGVSNMTIPKLDEMLPLCRIMPAFNEIEIHPAFQQWEMFEYCRSKGIVPIAYSPLGSAERPKRDTEAGDTAVMEMPELVKIGKNHGIHPALVCIKWAVQRGHIPVPFSVKQTEYCSNLAAVTEDPLTDEEMEIIRQADRNDRLIKGKVFLWPGAESWKNIWDLNNEIDRTGWTL